MGMVMQACNHSTWKVEAGNCELNVSELHSETLSQKKKKID
jgi:hypothetical protein